MDSSATRGEPVIDLVSDDDDVIDILSDDEVIDLVSDSEDEVAAEIYREKARVGGKAILIVERIIGEIEVYKHSNYFYKNTRAAVKYEIVRCVERNDLIYHFVKMIREQSSFRDKGYCYQVDIGFHYTDEKNLTSIVRNGLMSNQERSNCQIESFARNGSVFGDGIYTGNYPQSCEKYGDVGLIVARLKGKSVKVTDFGRRPFFTNEDIDACTTIVGNKNSTAMKWPELDSYDEVILKKTSQCVPIVIFWHVVDRYCYIEYLAHKMKEILNEFLNND